MGERAGGKIVVQCWVLVMVAIFGASFWKSAGASGVYRHRGTRSGIKVEPTNNWNFVGAHGEDVAKKYREDLEEFRVGDVSCLRYCVKTGQTQNDSKAVKIAWTLQKSVSGLGASSNVVLNKNLDAEIMGERALKHGKFDSNECTFSLVVGCAIPKEDLPKFNIEEAKFIDHLRPTEDLIRDPSQEILFRQDKMKRASEVSFIVGPNDRELNVVIFGNLSNLQLEMPIDNNIRSAVHRSAAAPTTTTTTTTTNYATSAAAQVTLSSERMPEDRLSADSYRLAVRNPSSGRYRLKIAGSDDHDDGDDSSGYRVTVLAAKTTTPAGKIDANRLVGGSPSANFASSYDKPNDDGETTGPRIARSDHYHNDNQVVFPIPEADNNQFDENMPFKFPHPEVIEDNGDDHNITSRIGTDQIEARVLHRDGVNFNLRSTSFKDELPLKQPLTVEVDARSSLVAKPGSVHNLGFVVTNNHMLPVRHYFFAKSKQFQALIVPPYGGVWIFPGQSILVVVQIPIDPIQASSENPDTVTFEVDGIETIQKTTLLYIDTNYGSNGINGRFDDYRPQIKFYFNNNCIGRTRADACLKSHWSVDIEILDSDSGLKTVTSEPIGVYPVTQYESGTRNTVKFYYTNNCCNPLVRISALDALSNESMRLINVNVWYNLTAGEICAIIFGILLLFAIIGLIILTTLYCRKKKTLDLSYSQRYGSRASPRTTTE